MTDVGNVTGCIESGRCVVLDGLISIFAMWMWLICRASKLEGSGVCRDRGTSMSTKSDPVRSCYTNSIISLVSYCPTSMVADALQRP